MLIWLVGTNGYNTSMGGTILGANLVVIIIAIVISSVVSGWLAHVLQTRTGMSPWLVGPMAVVSVTAVSTIAIFLIGIVIVGVVDSTRKRPPQQQPPAVNRRGAMNK
ncbi:MAG TPA: hypothetical protein VF611_10240 [Pyrinomonadaceae bacterium]